MARLRTETDGPSRATTRPSADEDTTWGELARSIPDGVAEEDFLARADLVQRDLAGRLRDVYSRAEFADLLALRMTNLIVARYHFEHRHAVLASRPLQLMLDTVNNCHLGCPGCVHSSTPGLRTAYEWPGGRLSEEAFDRFLAEYGPYAWGLVLFNWGEPLLDRRTPSLIRRAKRFMLHVCMSSNLSVRLDVDELARSGLNFLFASVDGATQANYEKFRRGGDLALCLENMRRITEARRREGTGLPFVIWRFLTFEHNAHEVEDALALAREVGVDEFAVSTPFEVPWDDPAFRAVDHPLRGSHLLNPQARFRGPLDEWRTADLATEAIRVQVERRWRERLPRSAGTEAFRAHARTCHWLYQNITMDAGARLMPCCMAPETGQNKVFGNFESSGEQSHNAQQFVLARLGFADRERFDASRDALCAPAPYCTVCDDRPEMPYDLQRDLGRDLRILDEYSVFAPELVRELTEWPKSR